MLKTEGLSNDLEESLERSHLTWFWSMMLLYMHFCLTVDQEAICIINVISDFERNLTFRFEYFANFFRTVSRVYTEWRGKPKTIQWASVMWMGTPCSVREADSRWQEGCNISTNHSLHPCWVEKHLKLWSHNSRRQHQVNPRPSTGIQGCSGHRLDRTRQI